MREWLEQVNEIKHDIDSIFNRAKVRLLLEQGRMTFEQVKQEYRHEYIQWLAKAHRVRDKWGDEKFPLDIKLAVNDVQDGIGVEKTVFPADPGWAHTKEEWFCLDNDVPANV